MSAPAAPLLRVQDFSFAYGEHEVLRRLTFAITPGEFVTIIGPNGAGKSTLLKCIMRVLPGGRGLIEVAGRPLATYRQAALARIISYVPQGLRGPLPWTVREFVMMGRYPYLHPLRSATPQDDAAVAQALALTGMAGFADRELGDLSGGERQTARIAAALAQEAGLLLLDEPATFLDPRHQDEVNRLLCRLSRQEGRTILAVTHDINAAALTSDRLLAIRDGELVFSGPPAEVMTNDVLSRIYGKAFTFITHPQTGQKLIVPEAVK